MTRRLWPERHYINFDWTTVVWHEYHHLVANLWGVQTTQDSTLSFIARTSSVFYLDFGVYFFQRFIH